MGRKKLRSRSALVGQAVSNAERMCQSQRRLPKVSGFQPYRIDMQIGLVHIARLDHRRFWLPAIEAAATTLGFIAMAGLNSKVPIQSRNPFEVGG
jgi:hypothetical protein